MQESRMDAYTRIQQLLLQEHAIQPTVLATCLPHILIMSATHVGNIQVKMYGICNLQSIEVQEVA